MSAVVPAHPTAQTTGKPAGFRPDVEGLRAVAVLSVMAYHAGLPLIGGGYAGVDVFFVLSGFLITGQLLKEVGATGTVDLPAFYGRRARRLLPAATVVILATGLLSWLMLPATRFREIAGDMLFSSLYVVNWRLADRSVDYLAEDSQPSPLQHYWSLAVEEQFYVVWPLLLLLVAVAVTRLRTPLGPTATVGLLAIAVPSLVWSVVHTAESPATAYFVTTTRLWELALGGLVACGVPLWHRISPLMGTVLVVGGLVALVASFFVITSATAWPGVAAVVPTLATALVLVGGATASGLAVRALGSAPMLWVGALSYSLYLWHWPLVTLVRQGLHDGEAPLWATTGAVLGAVPLAWLSHRLVENPVRHAPTFRRTRNALGLGGGLAVFGALGAAMLIQVSPTVKGGDVDPESASGRVGAEALLPPGVDPDAVPGDVRAVVSPEALPDAPETISPSPLEVTEDLPPTRDRNCVTSVNGTEVKTCTFGTKGAQRTLVVTGDSKIDQWIPVIDTWAQRHGYEVRTFMKSACPFNAELLDADDPRWQGCHSWGQEVAQRIADLDPDLVLTSSLMAGAGENGETKVVTGYKTSWNALLDAGAEVVVVDDTPGPGDVPVYECVAENLEHVSACEFPAKGGRGSATLKKSVEAVPGVRWMSMHDFVCPQDVCRPVVGGVLTYRQGSHLSNSYVRTTQGIFHARLDAALKGAA